MSDHKNLMQAVQAALTEGLAEGTKLAPHIESRIKSFLREKFDPYVNHPYPQVSKTVSKLWSDISGENGSI